MDLYLFNESNTKTASGKVLAIALIGIASLFGTSAPTQCSPRHSQLTKRRKRKARSRYLPANQQE